jgi:hypothetical protein
MKKAQPKITKKQIQAIQVIRRRAGIPDDVWTEMKRSVGAESTRDLTDTQFDQLLTRLGVAPPARGGSRREPSWKPMHHSARASGMHRKPPQEKEALIRGIEAILAELKLPWSYADGIAHRMFGIDALRFCDAEQTHKVQQALIIRRRKLASKAAVEAKEGQA